MKNKEQFYENATKDLLNRIDKMGLDLKIRLQAKNLVLLMRDSFKLSDVRQKVFSTVSPGLEWKETSYYSCGFCRSSTFVYSAFMNFINGSNEWDIMYLPYEVWSNGSHYFLKHKKSDLILDITADQYSWYNIDIPYNIALKTKIDSEGKFTIIRFLNSVNMDFMPIIKNLEKEL
jgi:hypothetical protein